MSGYQRSTKGVGSFPESFGHHFAGLVDGEGHFGIIARRKPTGTVSYGCVFAMDLRDDDTAALELLHKTIGLGSLFNSGPRNQGPQRLDAKPVCMWRIHRRTETLMLVEILEEYRLWTKKARDFAIWAKAVRYWNGARPEGQAPLARWQREIRAVREYGSTEIVPYEGDALPLFEDEL